MVLEYNLHEKDKYVYFKKIIDIYSISKKWLDFGISTEDGGRILNEGLISQKEGFGGRTITYNIWKLSI